MTTTDLPGFRRREVARRGLGAHLARTGKEGLEPGVLGLMLFVASEVMFFAGLFGAYFTFRADATVWPPPRPDNTPFEALSVSYAAWLTVILVSSSVTMQGAVFAIRRDLQRLAGALTTLTFLLGAIFVVGQAREWAKLEFNIKEGVYPSLFYTITGFHGLHVIGGLIAISFLIWKSATRSFTAKSHAMLESVSFYWHFVDVVWLGVFTALYLTTRGGA